MKLAQYIPFVEGISPAGLIIAGIVIGAVGAPFLKKGLHNLAVGLVGGTLAAGRLVSRSVHEHAGWWGSVVEEARARRESRLAEKRGAAGSGAAAPDTAGGAEPGEGGWTFNTDTVH